MDRDAAPTDLAEPLRLEAPGPFKSGTLRVPMRGEQAMAAKEVVVYAEVVIRKTPMLYRQEVTDTVRRLRVEVEEDVRSPHEPRLLSQEGEERPREP